MSYKLAPIAFGPKVFIWNRTNTGARKIVLDNCLS